MIVTYECEGCGEEYDSSKCIVKCESCFDEICESCERQGKDGHCYCIDCIEEVDEEYDSSNDFSEDNNDSVDECKNINEEECLFYDE